MAQNLTKNFVYLRRARLALKTLAKLGFYHAESGFNVTALMVVAHKLSLVGLGPTVIWGRLQRGIESASIAGRRWVMPKKQTDQTKRRTKVKDLPRKEKELSKTEQKRVKGASKAEMYCEELRLNK
jgi:hypothetical protein